MKRPLAAIAGALALAIAASACSSKVSDNAADQAKKALAVDAATVNGEHISRAEFEGDMRSLATNEAFKKAGITAQAAGQQSPFGETAGTMSSAFIASQLQNRILLTVIKTEVAKRQIVVTPELTTNGAEVAKGILGISDDEVWTTLPEELKTRYTAMGANYLALQNDFKPKTDAEIKALYDEVKGELPICLSHILVATEDEAKAAIDEIKQGKSFEDVAKARSTDPGSKETGGNLNPDGQCSPTTTYVPEFAKAAQEARVGEMTAPVKTEFGYHIIRVDKGAPAVEELKDKLVTYGGQKGTGEFMKNGASAATISVDPHYGKWDAASGAVLPDTAAEGTAAEQPKAAPTTDQQAIPTTTAG